MSFESTCRLYRVISDIGTRRYIGKLETGRYDIAKSLQSIATAIMLYWFISMQIGHCKTYATIIKTNLANTAGLADKSCRSYYCRAVLRRDLRIYDKFIVGLVLRYFLISGNFVFWFMVFFSHLWKVFFFSLEMATSFEWIPSSRFVSGRTGDLLRTTCGKRCVFPANYPFWNWVASRVMLE